MKGLILAIPLAFAIGCGDKDEDTGEETEAVEETDTGADTGAEGDE